MSPLLLAARPPSCPPAERRQPPRSMRHRRPEVQGSKRPRESSSTPPPRPDSVRRRREPAELRRRRLLPFSPSSPVNPGRSEVDGATAHRRARARLEAGRGAGGHVSLPHPPAAAPPPPPTSGGMSVPLLHLHRARTGSRALRAERQLLGRRRLPGLGRSGRGLHFANATALLELAR
jgi:hypothetical protein